MKHGFLSMRRGLNYGYFIYFLTEKGFFRFLLIE